MKFTVVAECSPAEARAFLGLPDLAPLNEHLVNEMKDRLDSNMAMLQPDEMMKSWLSLGGQAQEQFLNLVTAVSRAPAAAKPRP